MPPLTITHLVPLTITHLVVVEGPPLVWWTCDLVVRDRMVTVSESIVFDEAIADRNGNESDGNGRDDDEDMVDVVAARRRRVAIVSPPVTRTSGLPRSRGGTQTLPTAANCDTPTTPSAIDQQRPIDHPGNDQDVITRAAPSGRSTTAQHARATVVTPRHASETVAQIAAQEEAGWTIVTPRTRGRRRRRRNGEGRGRNGEAPGSPNPLLEPWGTTIGRDLLC